ncbi:MAG: hypothetical protein V4651_05030 [Bacteroidota bacterium]
MKTFKKVTFAFIILIIAITSFSSCKKGTDDPVISLKTRKDRITNTWYLVKYEKNGVNQDTSGSSYVYSIASNGTLTRTVQGVIFGFPTRTVTNGTWTFLNDDEDIQITIDSKAVVYGIQRLATKELWLKEIVGTDTYIYYFNGN